MSEFIGILCSVICSVIVTFILNRKLYFLFHRGKITEDIILNGFLQVRNSLFFTIGDLKRITEKDNMYISTLNGEPLNYEPYKRKSDIEIGKMIQYFRIYNNSCMNVLLSSFILCDNSTINLHKYPFSGLEKDSSIGLIISSYSYVKALVFDYNGREVVYMVGERDGYLPCVVKKSKRIVSVKDK